MGIYSNTRFNSVGTIDIDVPANENYNLVTGCAMALVEGYQNDLAIFEATIRSDMAEVCAVNEGMEVINESAKDVWNKIKEIFKKLLEKIKGVFKSFMARISGVFRESESLYNKYNKLIGKTTNWKGFKAKWRKAKASDIVTDIGTKASYKFTNDYNIQSVNSPSENTSVNFKWSEIIDKDNTIDTSDILDKIFENKLSNDIKGDVSKLDDINKALMDAVFDDEELNDEWKAGDLLHSCIGDLLKEASKNENKIKKANDNLEYTIKKIIDALDKENDKITKAVTNARLDKDYSYTNRKVGVAGTADDINTGKAKGKVSAEDRIVGSSFTKTADDATNKANLAALENIERVVQFYQRYANQEQAVINKLTSARLAAYKFAITQARRIWSSAAAFASVDHKNEAYEYYTAVGEAVEYDTLSDLQAV